MSGQELAVLMAVKDGERHLSSAVESLLNQTFRDFVLVVVDDGSTDATPEILKRFAARDDRVTIVTNERTRRLPASLNRGLAFCNAPLTARADADDEYHPERLERQVAAMRARPDLVALSCGFERIDESGAILSVSRAMTDSHEARHRLCYFKITFHGGQAEN